MPIGVTIGTPAARKLLKLLAATDDKDLTETREEIKAVLDLLPRPAPWRKVVGQSQGTLSRYDDLECGHYYSLKGGNILESHAKKRRCKMCLGEAVDG